LITDRGVGNGMSLLIFTSIAAGFPGSLWADPAAGRGRWDVFFGVILIGFFVIALVVFVEQSSAGSRCSTPSGWSAAQMYGGSSTYIPIKVNMAGVIPVIFASSLLALPLMWPSSHRPDGSHNGRLGDRGQQTNLVQGDTPLHGVSS
jgi:preprotein translocase subunit SecY